MKLFNKVCVIGVGLIGGSFGMAVRKRGLAGEVIGLVRRENAIEETMETGAVDRATMDPADVLDSDLFFLSTPVETMKPLLEKLAGGMRKDAIVTDAASVKGTVVSELETVLEGRASFVGAHPMAGSEKRSVFAANADLFDGCTCIVIRTDRTDGNSLHAVRLLWEALGAEVCEMDPFEHDRAVAAVSHLPHLVSSALVNMLAGRDEADGYLKCSGKGWADMTRIACGIPEMWAGICLENRENVLSEIDRFQSSMNEIRGALDAADRKKLREALNRASLFNVKETDL